MMTMMMVMMMMMINMVMMMMNMMTKIKMAITRPIFKLGASHSAW